MVGDDRAGLGFLGTDYTQTSLEDRETIFFNEEAVRRFLGSLDPLGPIRELVILSTCNRCEFYFFSSDPKEATAWLKRVLGSFLGLTDTTLLACLKVKHGPLVADHLLKVSAGIESMVFGETEVLGQVKSAYGVCQKAGKTGPILNKLFQMAIAAGKRVREETTISKGAYSISSIAVDVAQAHYNSDFFDRKILVFGAGTMALRAIRKLSALKHPNVFVTNRTEEKLWRISQKYLCEARCYQETLSDLSNYDVVLIAVNVSQFLLGEAHFKAVAHTPILLIDLGVPRNIDPAVKSNPNITLISLDNLTQTAEKNLANRKKELAKINSILAEELYQFGEWANRRQSLCLSV